MIAPEKEYCFFLVPEEPLRSQLNPIIEKLAADYNAVVFVPHVTAYVCSSNDKEAHHIGDLITRTFAPIELTPECVDCTDHFYKTLFVQFRESQQLRKMSDAVPAECAWPSAYELNSHLSLLYQRIPHEERQRLAVELTPIVPQGPYRLETLWVVEADQAESCDTVRRWRKVYEGKLLA